MKRWMIENTASGVVLGVYEGETERDALDAMARDAGYRDHREASEVAGGSENLVLTEMRLHWRDLGVTDSRGTRENPIRYEHIKRNDPNRQEKLDQQRKQFEQDAKDGMVLCLSDLLISHGL